MAGTNALTYQVVEGWEQLPKGYEHRDVAGVAVDAEDRVFLICRGDHPIMVYDHKGKFLSSWGEGQFTYRTHGITIGPDGSVYCTDDGNHTVRKFTPQGKLLLTLGTMDKPSDTGYDGKDTMTVSRPGVAVQPADEPGGGPEGRSLRLRRLRQLPRAPVLAERRAQALVGRARQGPRPVHPAPRHRGRRGRAHLRLRPGERSHPDLQPRRRVPLGVDRHPAADAPRVRPAGPRLRLRALVAQGPDLAAPRPHHRSALRARERVRQGRPPAHPLGHARIRPRPAASRRPTASRWTRAATSSWPRSPGPSR